MFHYANLLSCISPFPAGKFHPQIFLSFLLHTLHLISSGIAYEMRVRHMFPCPNQGSSVREETRFKRRFIFYANVVDLYLEICTRIVQRSLCLSLFYILLYFSLSLSFRTKWKVAMFFNTVLERKPCHKRFSIFFCWDRITHNLPKILQQKA